MVSALKPFVVLLSPAGAPTPPAVLEGWLERFVMTEVRTARDFVRDLYVRPPLSLPIVTRTCRGLFHRGPVRQLVASARSSSAFEPAMCSCRLPGVAIFLVASWTAAPDVT